MMRVLNQDSDKYVLLLAVGFEEYSHPTYAIAVFIT